MEQKRVLGIVAAVGLFLLVVIGAAMLVYSPVQPDTKLTALESNGSLWISTDTPVTEPSVIEVSEKEPDVTSVQTLTVHSENTIVYNATGEETIQVVAPKTETPATTTTTEATPAAETKPVAAVTPVTPAATAKPAETKTTAAAKPAETKTTAPAATTSTKATTVKTVTKKAEDSFFVQVGSFTSKKNAEDARSLLTDEKIPAEIFTWKNDKGTVFFRLRIGPYKTKTEANYWLSRIKQIDGFATESAYVVNAPATEE